MIPSVKIPFKILMQLRTYGMEHNEVEVGGLLLGRFENDEKIIAHVGQFHPVKNIGHSDARVDYQLDPNAVFHILKKTTIFDPNMALDFVGIFHTHPFNKPVPSQTDIEYAQYLGFYLIYSPLYDDFGTFYSHSNENHAKDMLGQKNFDRAKIILSN